MDPKSDVLQKRVPKSLIFIQNASKITKIREITIECKIKIQIKISMGIKIKMQIQINIK